MPMITTGARTGIHRKVLLATSTAKPVHKHIVAMVSIMPAKTNRAVKTIAIAAGMETRTSHTLPNNLQLARTETVGHIVGTKSSIATTRRWCRSFQIYRRAGSDHFRSIKVPQLPLTVAAIDVSMKVESLLTVANALSRSTVKLYRIYRTHRATDNVR